VHKKEKEKKRKNIWLLLASEKTEQINIFSNSDWLFIKNSLYILEKFGVYSKTEQKVQSFGLTYFPLQHNTASLNVNTSHQSGTLLQSMNLPFSITGSPQFMLGSPLVLHVL
jgi:hypothetical protein